MTSVPGKTGTNLSPKHMNRAIFIFCLLAYEETLIHRLYNRAQEYGPTKS